MPLQVGKLPLAVESPPVGCLSGCFTEAMRNETPDVEHQFILLF